jgi:hypothetical protein
MLNGAIAVPLGSFVLRSLPLSQESVAVSRSPVHRRVRSSIENLEIAQDTRCIALLSRRCAEAVQ